MEIETLSTETYVADALTRFHFQCKLHGFCSVDANQTTSTASFCFRCHGPSSSSGEEKRTRLHPRRARRTWLVATRTAPGTLEVHVHHDRNVHDLYAGSHGHTQSCLSELSVTCTLVLFSIGDAVRNSLIISRSWPNVLVSLSEFFFEIPSLVSGKMNPVRHRVCPPAE